MSLKVYLIPVTLLLSNNLLVSGNAGVSNEPVVLTASHGYDHNDLYQRNGRIPEPARPNSPNVEPIVNLPPPLDEFSEKEESTTDLSTNSTILFTNRTNHIKSTELPTNFEPIPDNDFSTEEYKYLDFHSQPVETTTIANTRETVPAGEFNFTEESAKMATNVDSTESIINSDLFEHTSSFQSFERVANVYSEEKIDESRSEEQIRSYPTESTVSLQSSATFTDTPSTEEFDLPHSTEMVSTQSSARIYNTTSTESTVEPTAEHTTEFRGESTTSTVQSSQTPVNPQSAETTPIVYCISTIYEPHPTEVPFETTSQIPVNSQSSETTSNVRSISTIFESHFTETPSNTRVAAAFNSLGPTESIDEKTDSTQILHTSQTTSNAPFVNTSYAHSAQVSSTQNTTTTTVQNLSTASTGNYHSTTTSGYPSIFTRFFSESILFRTVLPKIGLYARFPISTILTPPSNSIPRNGKKTVSPRVGLYVPALTPKYDDNASAGEPGTEVKVETTIPSPIIPIEPSLSPVTFLNIQLPFPYHIYEKDIGKLQENYSR